MISSQCRRINRAAGAFLLAGAIIVSTPTWSAASDINYDIIFGLPNGLNEIFVTGTITTDGTTGALSSTNIVDWKLALFTGFGQSFQLTPADSITGLVGTGLTATTTGLFLDFSTATEFNFTHFDVFNNPADILDFCGTNPFPFGCSHTFFITGVNALLAGPFADLSESGNVEIAEVSTAVPEPSTLMLFAIGLVGLWRIARRRRPTRSPSEATST